MSENSSAPRKALTAMRLGELQELAATMGLELDAKARRNDFISAIRKARDAGRPVPQDAPSAQEDASSAPVENTREAQQAPAIELPEPAQATESAPDLPEDKLAALEALGEAASRKAEEAYRRSSRGRRDEDDRGQNTNRDQDSEDEGDGRRRRNDRRRDRGNRNRDDRGRNDRNDRSDRNDRNDRSDRRDRSNRRNNERQNDGDSDFNDQVRDGDVLLKVAGILDIDGNNAYLRTAGYLPGPNDAYVSAALIKKNKLRRGDAIVGAVRDLGESSGQGRQSRQRHKFNPLVQIDSVNGLSLEDLLKRPEFGKLTPLYPNEMLRMETSPKAITPRVIDLVAPIGKGQRGLIVSPPKAGKTMIMQQIANAIAVNNPDVHLMVVLVDERPEEVTDMQRMVKGEVIASTFDRPAAEHTVVAELAIERAKRLVELGQDVVVLLDSITRLGRAYNLAAPASGRILSGGVDAGALYPPKRFFGAARNVENGGSLTIVASALVETGSKMDEVIFEEFKGTGNMELRLSRQLADRRIFPAVDVNASGTRREELLFSPEELKIVWQLRRALGTLEVQESSDFLLGRLRKSESNGEFLMTIAKSMQKSGE
ncbi:MAG: transcription termination factor Rho [Flaviflexus sp.]|uniref:transcription termination factor Rho n=1 Tax=Flaviflexus sp. TaxID=1969482 RepID=UPI00352C5D24